MNENKLSSSEVPVKFAEWLLAMGCSPNKVPTTDKVVEMCRGHYMVWRSLMEHVEPKDVIRQKRLQVFCDDVRKWKRKSVYKYQKDTEAVIPDELELWNQQHDIKEKVSNAENKVGELQKNLNQLMDKISSKLTHCKLSRKRLQDIQRRVWLLQQISEELTTKKENLEETKNIANSLCLLDDSVDLQSKLDRYLSSLRRPVSQSTLVSTSPVANSTVASTNGDLNETEDQLSWVAKCRGEALWQQLYERRAGLVAALSHDTVAQKRTDVRSTPESVLSHTASMHCSLALEAVKNRVHIKQRRKMLATAITETGCHLTHEECELLVLQCERARAHARVNSLRVLLQEVTSRQGIFCAGNDGSDDRRSTVKQIAGMDKAILSKKDDLQKLVTSLSVTEKKIQNVQECLEAIFGGFQKDPPVHREKYRGQLDLPQDSISVLRQFYEERREARRNKMQLSLDLDASENSYSEGLENRSPKFADELKIYLKQFCLEKNRKLILESGEKIWIFETLQAALSRARARWLDADISCLLVCPSVGLLRNLDTIAGQVWNRKQLEGILEAIQSGVVKSTVSVDISLKSQEDEILDKIKKRLNDNILSLQRTNKTLDGGEENLKFWAENEIKKFVSHKRNVDGKSYQDYELFYAETIRLNTV